MVTADEEAQAKEFLKRAEIRTMKKDLRALREVDALKERDKIAKLKTLEEQLSEKKEKDIASSFAKALEDKDKAGRNEVLQRNEGQERIAEKDLKKYATEEERQQIFLLESQRLGIEKEIDAIDKEKDPALKLEKNRLLLQRSSDQAKLNSILEEEKKLETEQKAITEKEQTTTIASQRKSLEQARWDLDKKIQEVEKKRWEAEKQMQETDEKINQVDRSSEILVVEKNSLRNKVLGADKSLRDIYSFVMNREEEKRRGKTSEQLARREILEKARTTESEKIQRQQWNSPAEAPRFTRPGIARQIPVPIPIRNKMAKSFEAEEEARKKFIQDVEQGVNKSQGQPQQKSIIK